MFFVSECHASVAMRASRHRAKWPTWTKQRCALCGLTRHAATSALGAKLRHGLCESIGARRKNQSTVCWPSLLASLTKVAVATHLGKLLGNSSPRSMLTRPGSLANWRVSSMTYIHYTYIGGLLYGSLLLRCLALAGADRCDG